MSQPELLYSDLPNYANRPTEERPGELLVKMAAQATAQAEAEAATQGHETAVALNKGSCVNAGLREGLSHIDKKNTPSEMERERQDLDDSRWVRFNTLKELLFTAKGKCSTRDSDALRTNKVLRHFHGKKMTSSGATSMSAAFSKCGHEKSPATWEVKGAILPHEPY